MGLSVSDKKIKVDTKGIVEKVFSSVGTESIFMDSGRVNTSAIVQSVFDEIGQFAPVAESLGISDIPRAQENPLLEQFKEGTPDVTAPAAAVGGFIAGTVPFLDKIPGLRENFNKAREAFPTQFGAGKVAGTFIPGAAALKGAKVLLKPLVKQALPLIKSSKKAVQLLTQAGIAVSEGVVADLLFSAVSVEKPSVKSMAAFAAVDAVLPGLGAAMKAISRKLKAGRQITQEVKDVLPKKKPITTPSVPESKTLIEEVMSTVNLETGNLKRGTAFIRTFFKGRTDDELRKLGIWAQKQKGETKRFIVDEVGAELTARGSDLTLRLPVKQVATAPITKSVTLSEALENKPFQVTSARKAEIAQKREEMGLRALNTPETITWNQSLRNAKEKGIPDDALRLADEINITPRSFNDEETAGLVIKLSDLKSKYSKLNLENAKLTNPTDIKLKSAEIERLEEDFNRIHSALKKSGTEKGRTLAAQKLTIDQDFNLISVKQRARAASGNKLDEKQSKKFKAMIDRMDAKTKQVQQLEKELAEAQASGAVVGRRNKFQGMSTVQKDAELSSLVSKAKKLIDDGCQVIA